MSESPGLLRYPFDVGDEPINGPFAKRLISDPSGDPTPSNADVQMAKQIVDITKPLGIAIHDHIVVGHNRHATLRGLKLIYCCSKQERHMPTDRLTPGLKAEIVTTVDDKLVVKHMGGDGVLSTPSMIGLMERAGIDAVQAYLPEGHTTVGFEVNVKHFGATPKGKKVRVRAELLEVDGRKLQFKVEAHDEDKKVGDGTHRRAIIAIQRKD